MDKLIKILLESKPTLNFDSLVGAKDLYHECSINSDDIKVIIGKLNDELGINISTDDVNRDDFLNVGSVYRMVNRFSTDLSTSSHQSKDISKNNIFIFGCGSVGKILFQKLLKLYPTKQIRFCVNNPTAKSFCGADILHPKEAVEKYPDALFMIGTIIYQEEMLAQLKELGVSDDRVVAEIQNDVVIEYLRREKLKQNWIPRTELEYLDYHLADHCNLNCAGCAHFSNLADESFTDYETFRRDISHFAHIIGDRLQKLVLLGGEPLLNPDVERYLATGREFFPSSHVVLVTNGTLLLKMPESFWECCRENNIFINVSKYPVKLDDEGIRKKADKYGVVLNFYELGSSRGWRKYTLDLDGSKSPDDRFAGCINANLCPQLRNGRLYSCFISAGIEHFNKAFHKNLELIDEDSLDIYSINDAQEVFDFLSRPVPFCRYCNVDAYPSCEWSVTKRDISEYLA